MKSILIVDDSPLIRSTLRRFLEQQPDWLICGEAANGVEGIAQAERLVPDLVLLDMSMPVMNGFEAARELRRRMPNLPILMFTSFVSAQLIREASSAGVSLTRSKSDSIQLLGDDVRELLGRLPQAKVVANSWGGEPKP